MNSTAIDYSVSVFLDPKYVPKNIIESWWHYGMQVYGERNLFVISYVVLLVLYLVSGLFFYILEQFRVLPQYRLQPGKWPTNKDYIHALKNIFTNYFLFILPMIYFAAPFFSDIGIRADIAFPSFWWIFFEQIAFLIIEDIAQYVLHRMLHIPYLYKMIHKVHHENTLPFGLAASHAHPLEIIILGFCTFLGPLVFRSHLLSFYIWVNVRQLDAVKTHCGWVFPYDPCHWIPSYGGTLFHDYHHKAFVFNYASRFEFIDQMFGTYKVPANPLDMSQEEYLKRLPKIVDPYEEEEKKNNKKKK